MENFFSHKNSTLSFDFNSAVLIGNTDGDYSKSNGSGKSSIFEGLTWTLFNKSRAAHMNDLVKWGEEGCKSELIFVEGGEKYKIVRTRNRVSSTSSVSFYKLDEIKQWKDASGSTSTLTNNIIEKTIKMDYKTFVNSTYFKQNDISEFAESNPGDRKDILKNVLDLKKWDDYEAVAKDKARELKLDLKILESDLEDTESLTIKLGQKNLNRDAFSKKIADMKNRYSGLESRYSHTFEQYVNMKNSLDTDQFDKISMEISNLETQKSKIESEKAILKSQSLKYSKDISKVKDSISASKKKLSSLTFEHNIDSIEEENLNKVASMSSELKLTKLKIDEQDQLILSEDECSSCGQEITQELYDKIINEKHDVLDCLNKNLVRQQEELNLLKIEKKEIQQTKRNNSKYTSTKSDIERFEEKLTFHSENKRVVTQKLEAVKKSEGEVSSKLANLETALNNVKSSDFSTIKDSLKALKEDRINLNSHITNLEKDLSLCEKSISDINLKLDNNKELKKKIVSKKEEIFVFDSLKKYLGKQGIQVILLNGLIDDLEHYANNILKDICNEPLKISLETQRVKADQTSIFETLDLIIVKDGYKHDFKSLSGGEKFRISLSLRIGLGQLASKYGGGNLEFIMMDEINSPLDSYGTENLFVSVIKKLEKKYMVMLITHEETLKDKFENVIEISKVNGESSVNFYCNN